MKILTWNVNGIRAMKTDLKQLLHKLDADIICFQETKVTRDQLDEPSAIVEGYTSYFSFSKVRSGYSGVATFVKTSATPIKAEEGLTGLLSSETEEDNIGCYGEHTNFDEEELQALDNEGRTIITQHEIQTEQGKELLTVLNVYCPRADPEREDRKQFKMRFYELLEGRALELLQSGSHVIILGDVNTSHKRIDSCDPAEDFEERPTRKWLNQFLWDPGLTDEELLDKHDSHRFIDSFRYFHPTMKEAYTCWSTVTGARATNYGTRIDYIFGNTSLVQNSFTDCIILPEVEGSDHCPVKATLASTFVPSKKVPKLCTKFLPEFVGKQQKLSSFIVKRQRSEQLFSEPKTMPMEIESKGTENTHSDLIPTVSSSANVPDLKRGSSLQYSQPTKKLKQSNKKSSSGGKQGTLLGFFSKPKPEADSALKPSLDDKVLKPVVSKSHISTTKIENETVTSSIHKHAIETNRSANESVQNSLKREQSNAVSSWKNLLKGPPPAPLCKGHNEPCVLRTVKKDDSFNKGRQFWVCQKPDGAKDNPLARCDHFQWVEKKKQKT